jgi:hypothetical protein
MQYLRQSTTTVVQLGPFLSSTDAVTPQTGLITVGVEISKNGDAYAVRGSSYPVEHDNEGWYRIPLSTVDTGQLGHLVVKAHDPDSHLPVWRTFFVISVEHWADLYGTDGCCPECSEDQCLWSWKACDGGGLTPGPLSAHITIPQTTTCIDDVCGPPGCDDGTTTWTWRTSFSRWEPARQSDSCDWEDGWVPTPPQDNTNVDDGDSQDPCCEEACGGNGYAYWVWDKNSITNDGSGVITPGWSRAYFGNNESLRCTPGNVPAHPHWIGVTGERAVACCVPENTCSTCGYALYCWTKPENAAGSPTTKPGWRPCANTQAQCTGHDADSRDDCYCAEGCGASLSQDGLPAPSGDNPTNTATVCCELPDCANSANRWSYNHTDVNGGGFRFTYDSAYSTTIPWNASAVTVCAVLNELIRQEAGVSNAVTDCRKLGSFLCGLSGWSGCSVWDGISGIGQVTDYSSCPGQLGSGGGNLNATPPALRSGNCDYWELVQGCCAGNGCDCFPPDNDGAEDDEPATTQCLTTDLCPACIEQECTWEWENVSSSSSSICAPVCDISRSHTLSDRSATNSNPEHPFTVHEGIVVDPDSTRELQADRHMVLNRRKLLNEYGTLGGIIAEFDIRMSTFDGETIITFVSSGVLNPDDDSLYCLPSPSSPNDLHDWLIFVKNFAERYSSSATWGDSTVLNSIFYDPGPEIRTAILANPVNRWGVEDEWTHQLRFCANWNTHISKESMGTWLSLMAGKIKQGNRDAEIILRACVSDVMAAQDGYPADGMVVVASIDCDYELIHHDDVEPEVDLAAVLAARTATEYVMLNGETTYDILEYHNYGKRDHFNTEYIAKWLDDFLTTHSITGKKVWSLENAAPFFFFPHLGQSTPGCPDVGPHDHTIHSSMLVKLYANSLINKVDRIAYSSLRPIVGDDANYDRLSLMTETEGTGGQYDVLFIIDISGSTTERLPDSWSPVGDVDGDGAENTVLDAELAAYIALNAQLIETGANVRIGIVSFGTLSSSDPAKAWQLDMDPSLAGDQLTALPNDDTNNNGMLDVVETLRTLRSSGGTYYAPALDLALDFFDTLATQSGAGVVVFISDGRAIDAGSYGAQVDTLNDMGIDLRAFGVAVRDPDDAWLLNLRAIDPDAIIFTSTDELLAEFTDLGGSIGHINKKPAFYTYKALSRKLDGMRTIEEISVTSDIYTVPVDVDPPKIFRVTFNDPDKAQVLIAWDDNTPKDENILVDLTGCCTADQVLLTHIIDTPGQRSPTLQVVSTGLIPLNTKPVLIDCGTCPDPPTHRPGIAPWEKIKTAIAALGCEPYTQTLDFTVSFIRAGNFAKDCPPTGPCIPGSVIIKPTVELKDYGGFVDDRVTHEDFKAEVMAAIGEWKYLFEDLYGGLTINFHDIGEEGDTNQPSSVLAADNHYALPGSDGIGDFRIGMHYIDGPANIFGHSRPPQGTLSAHGICTDCGTIGGDTHFDSGENWRLDAVTEAEAISIKHTMAAQFGFSLGLGIDGDSTSIMYPTVSGGTNFSDMFPGGLVNSRPDRCAVLDLYGADPTDCNDPVDPPSGDPCDRYYEVGGEPWPNLIDAIQNLDCGSPQTATFTYSFILAGNTAWEYNSASPPVLTAYPTVEVKDWGGGGIANITHAQFVTEVTDSFGEWKEIFEDIYPGLTVVFTDLGDEATTSTSSSAAANIKYALPGGVGGSDNIGDFRIGMHEIDGPASVIAHGYWPRGTPSNGQPCVDCGTAAGDIHFDDEENWRLDSVTESGAISLKWTTTHEIGHVFGLGHDTDVTSVMFNSVATSANYHESFPDRLKGSEPDRCAVINRYGDPPPRCVVPDALSAQVTVLQPHVNTLGVGYFEASPLTAQVTVLQPTTIGPVNLYPDTLTAQITIPDPDINTVGATAGADCSVDLKSQMSIADQIVNGTGIWCYLTTLDTMALPDYQEEIDDPIFESAVRRISLDAPGDGPGTPLSDAIVAYWQLEEDGGTRVDQVNTTGSANGDHPLTDNNTVDRMGGKVDIDGDGQADWAARFYPANSEYLSHPFDADLHFSSSQSFTLALWARPSDQLSGRHLAGNDEYSIAQFAPNVGTDHIGWRWHVGQSDVEVVRAWTANEWVFIVGRYDADDNVLSISINGDVPSGLATASYTNSPGAGTEDFEIGKGPYASPGYYGGRIDEVGLWGRALSDADVSELWNNGNGTSSPFAPSGETPTTGHTWCVYTAGTMDMYPNEFGDQGLDIYTPDHTKIKYPVGHYWNSDGSLLHVQHLNDDGANSPPKRQILYDGGYGFFNGAATSARDDTFGTGNTGKARVAKSEIISAKGLPTPDNTPYEPVFNCRLPCSNFLWSMDTAKPKIQYGILQRAQHITVYTQEQDASRAPTTGNNAEGKPIRTKFNSQYDREFGLPFFALPSGKMTGTWPSAGSTTIGTATMGQGTYIAVMGDNWGPHEYGDGVNSAGGTFRSDNDPSDKDRLGPKENGAYEGIDMWLYIVNLDYDPDVADSPGPVVAALNISDQSSLGGWSPSSSTPIAGSGEPARHIGQQWADTSQGAAKPVGPGHGSVRFSHAGRYVAVYYHDGYGSKASWRFFDIHENAYTTDPMGDSGAAHTNDHEGQQFNIAPHDFSNVMTNASQYSNGSAAAGFNPLVLFQHPTFATSKALTTQTSYGVSVQKVDEYFVGHGNTSSPEESNIPSIHGKTLAELTTEVGIVDGIDPITIENPSGWIGRIVALNLTADSANRTGNHFKSLDHPGAHRDYIGTDPYQVGPGHITASQDSHPENPFDAAYVYVRYGNRPGTNNNAGDGDLFQGEIVAFNLDDPNRGMIRVVGHRTATLAGGSGNYGLATSHPHVSPDGRKLVFNSSWSGNGGLGPAGQHPGGGDDAYSQNHLFVIDLVAIGMVDAP